MAWQRHSTTTLPDIRSKLALNWANIGKQDPRTYALALTSNPTRAADHDLVGGRIIAFCRGWNVGPRPKAAATGLAAEHNPPEQSVAMARAHLTNQAENCNTRATSPQEEGRVG